MIVLALLAFVVAVLLSALFSGLETGIYTTSRLRLVLDAGSGVRAAEQARRLLQNMPSLLSVLLVSNNATHYAASYAAQVLLAAWGTRSPELVGSLAVSAVLFLLAESVPKSAYRRGRERLLYPTMPLLVATHALLSLVTWPVTWCSTRLARAVERRLRRQAVPRGAREAMLRTGAAEGFLTSFQERVARGVLAMRNTWAGGEALPLDRYPTTRVGLPGVSRPAQSREHRALVLDSGGERVIGWVPLAQLREPGGFRPARRRELRPVAQVEAGMSLDRAYVSLHRSGSPFATVRTGTDIGVLDLTRLRQRVMGTLGVPEA